MARAVRGRFLQTRDLWKRASLGERVDVFRLTPSPGGRGHRAAVYLVVVCLGAAEFRVFFFFEFVFYSNVHGLPQV